MSVVGVEFVTVKLNSTVAEDEFGALPLGIFIAAFINGLDLLAIELDDVVGWGLDDESDLASHRTGFVPDRIGAVLLAFVEEVAAVPAVTDKERWWWAMPVQVPSCIAEGA